MWINSYFVTTTFLLGASAAAQSDANVFARAPPPEAPYLPRIYNGRGFSGFSQQDIPINGKCVRLGNDLFHSTSSIYIPCPAQAPENKKVICTLYVDAACATPIVSFDQSHDELSKYSAEQGNAVGNQLTSLKCEEVDVSTPAQLLNGYYTNSPSLNFKSGCPGDICQSGRDCLRDRTSNFRCLNGQPKTCKRASYLEDNARCEEDIECRAGICANRGFFGEASVRSFCSGRRVEGDLCEVDSECPDSAPQCCVSRFVKDDFPDAKPRCDFRDSCEEQSGRSCKPNDEGCLADSSCCSGKCRPSQIFVIPTCRD